MKPEYTQHPRYEYEEKELSVVEFRREYGSRNIPFAVCEFHTLGPVSVTLVAERHHPWPERGSRKYIIKVTDNKAAILDLFGCSTERGLIEVLTGRNQFDFSKSL